MFKRVISASICCLGSLCAQDGLMGKFKELIQQHQQLSSDFEISLDSDLALNLVRRDQCQIKNLNISQDGQRFTAQVTGPSKEDETKERIVPVCGKIQLLISVPVLARPVAVGEILSEADFVWHKMPISRINTGCCMNVQEMIGKSPSNRVLTPGQPISKHDLKSPILVKKATTIRVFYRTPGLELSRIAEAQQDGAKGDVIRFMVADNKRVINARVLSENEAEIMI